MTTKAVNLWYNPSRSPGPAIFSYPGESLLNYRGVDVFKNPAGSWDYVLNGATIAQRAGFNREGAKDNIDGLLDGTDNFQCSDKVLAHIEASKESKGANQ